MELKNGFLFKQNIFEFPSKIYDPFGLLFMYCEHRFLWTNHYIGLQLISVSPKNKHFK